MHGGFEAEANGRVYTARPYHLFLHEALAFAQASTIPQPVDRFKACFSASLIFPMLSLNMQEQSALQASSSETVERRSIGEENDWLAWCCAASGAAQTWRIITDT